MIPYKIQLEKLKKRLNDIEEFKGSKYYELLEIQIKAKISLREQDISDLKKEWLMIKDIKNDFIDENYLLGRREAIEQLTGMSSEELKEVQK